MPQLVKRGKHIFGWVQIDTDGGMHIPPEAFTEYGFTDFEKVFIIPGSKTSRGFTICKKATINKALAFNSIIDTPELLDFRTEEGIPVKVGKREVCWSTIGTGGTVPLPVETLKVYGAAPGARLLAGRGSYVGVSLLARGPIFEEALKHPELEVF